jgi:alkylated DNA repair dioxygenase AlkB
MELFPADPTTNLLPRDGAVFYHGPVFAPQEAVQFLGALGEEVPWENDEVVLYGKRIVMGRKVAWFGDAGFAYSYSGTTKQALPWTPAMARLRDRVQKLTGARFNSCLANFYHSGEEGMSWHSDDERTLVRNAAIASLSFGAERRFRFRHKETKEMVEVNLEDGSLLEMRDETQVFWQHCLPKTKKVGRSRINLTFRLMDVLQDR